jgi:protein involved in plasmid replication-relaxation
MSPGLSARSSARVAEPHPECERRHALSANNGADSSTARSAADDSPDRRSTGSDGRIGPRQLAELERHLSARDRAILGDVASLRLLCAAQVQALHFPAEAFASPLSAARQTRRTLARLHAERLLVRLNRRVGGVRAGSAGFIYGLGPVGHRVLEQEDRRPRVSREPSSMFVSHTLAVSELVVQLALAVRVGYIRGIERQAEPECWRLLPGYDRATLRPDLLVVISARDVELRWFIEVDRGTAHLPALLRKCALYEAYYRSGVEQAEHAVFPRVLWITRTAARASRLTDAIAGRSDLTDELFSAVTDKSALAALSHPEGVR